MEKLGLSNLLPTELLLQMVDHSKVLPVGVLVNVDTNIVGIVYKIDYAMFQLKSSTLSYPIFLGCPWLFDAKARNDWSHGTLTIGKRRNKIVLQMYLVTYHGESQLPHTNFTSDDDDNDLDENEDTSYGDEQFGPIQSHTHKIGAIYQCGRPGEYLIHQDDTDNCDRAIARWMNNYAVYLISAMELELDNTDLSEFVTDSELDEPLRTPKLVAPVCKEINLGTKDHPQPVMMAFKAENFRIGQSSFVSINQLLLGLMRTCMVYQLRLLNIALYLRKMLDQFGTSNIG